MMEQRTVQLNLPKAQSVDIKFTNVTYEVSMNFRASKKQILRGVSGHFKSGELTVIMGPSGAGKSTLLNILTGFNKNINGGTIEYIGNSGKYSWNEYRKQSCYIQQDDQLNPLFTTLEIMWIATNLKIGSSLNRKAKQMLIDDILDSLDLTRVKQTRCSCLSGGQKKRLSIALELVDNPPVMFLDEPTTGLDSLSSLQCVNVLHSLARTGRTVVCTIHQPSAGIYEIFDLVYLLAEGKCMYNGSAKNTVAYFAHLGLHCPKYHNPADYMIEVVSAEYGNFNEHLAKAAKNPEKSWRAPSPEKSIHEENETTKRYSDETKAMILVNPPTELERFGVLLNRSLVQHFRDWTVTHLKLGVHILVGILLGLLYTDSGADGGKTISNVGYLLVTTVYLCYTSMMPAVLKFPSELPTLRKERFNNWYKLKTYYIANLLTNLPLQMLFALTYCVSSYFLSSQPVERDRFLMFAIVAILTTFVAQSIGSILGTLVDPVNGTFLGAILTCVMLVFAGFLILLSHMPPFLYYVSYASYLRYSLHALVHSVYGFNREKLPCSENYCHYRTPQILMTDLLMTEGKYWHDVAFLACNFILLQALAYCTLKRKLSSL